MGDKRTGLSRRSFLQAAGIVAVGSAVAGLAGCTTDAPAAGSAAAGTPGYLPETWDFETDIVVVGYGGAGIAAATTIADESLGELLVIEAAPESGEGGNTRVSGALMLIPESVEGAVKYQTELNGMHPVEEELVRGWAENICANTEWFENLGLTLSPMSAYSPEFPEIEGSEAVRTYTVGGTMGMNSLWNALKELKDYLGYEVLYETRGQELVRNPETNEALGVIADQNGTKIAIKARKGVILSCGGFENNPEMCKNYLGVGQSKHPLGTIYNRGDGHAMVEPFGAQLWHMNNAAGSALAVYGQGFENGGVSSTPLGYAGLPLHSYIFVGHDGKRFMYEETSMNNRHGKILQGGVFVDFPTPEGAWAIFDETYFANVPISSKIESLIGWASTADSLVASDNQGYLDKGIIVKADTVEELARLIAVPAASLQTTLDTYNSHIAENSDPDFGRGQAVYEQFSGMGESTESAVDGEAIEVVAPFQMHPVLPPYYATALPGSILNTQGGPKRNASGQILNGKNEPIGRLYGTGEFGAIYSYMYNGGGNVSDAIASGRTAARHAATLAAWDAGAAE